jgi:hypothetical protein
VSSPVVSVDALLRATVSGAEHPVGNMSAVAARSFFRQISDAERSWRRRTVVRLSAMSAPSQRVIAPLATVNARIPAAGYVSSIQGRPCRGSLD